MHRHLEAFCAWLGLPGMSLQELAASAASREGAEQTYQVVAVLGFAADAGILVGTGSLAGLQAGLRRLSGRGVAIDGVPAPVCLDPVGVLGVALGARAVAPSGISDDVKKWVARFLTSSYSMERIEDWQRGLFAVADQLLGSVNGLRIPATPSAADLRVALRHLQRLSMVIAGAVEPRLIIEARGMHDERVPFPSRVG